MSSRIWLNLLLTVVIAGAAGFVGAWAGSGGLQPKKPQPSLLRQSVFEAVHLNLALTPAQQQQVQQIEDRYIKRRDGLRVRIRNANVELARALSEDMAFGPHAQAAIDHLQSSFGDLQSSTVLYVLEIRDVLTPAQRKLYDRRVLEALTNEDL